MDARTHVIFCVVLIVIGVLYILEGLVSDFFGFMRFFPWYATYLLLIGLYGVMHR